MSCLCLVHNKYRMVGKEIQISAEEIQILKGEKRDD